ncbi:MAG: MFS transporter [Caldisphaeraceae archaeon]|nr:MFS transporter [Caldisphaeraceae archaeon]
MSLSINLRIKMEQLIIKKGERKVSERQQKIILGVLVMGVFMASIDSTIVLLAFPAITQALHSNLATIIWVILIYMLVSAVAATQLGRIGDIFGRSRVFNYGIAIFTIFSFLCGIAPNAFSLIAFRAVQAFGGAMMSSNSGAIIADTFEHNKLGRAYGFTSMGWNIGAMVGIILGGIITTYVGYRYIFFINVPIGAVMFLLAVKYININRRVYEKLDFPGLILIGGLLALILFSGVTIASIGINGFDLAMLLIGFALIYPLIVIEKRNPNPIIKLEMFDNKVFRNSILALFFQALGYIGVNFMLIMYLQGVRGFTPFYAAVLLLPGYLISSVLAPIMGRLSDRYGARRLATLGTLVIIAGILVYMRLGVNSSIDLVLLGSAIIGIGASMFWPANNSAIMKSSKADRFGTASGLSRLFSSIGIMGSFIIVIIASTLVIPRKVAFEIFVGTSKLIGGVSSSFVHGMHFSFIFLIGILVIAALTSLTRGNENEPSSALS